MSLILCVWQWQEHRALSDEETKKLLLYCLDKILPCLQKLHQEQREELKVERSRQGKLQENPISHCAFDPE